MTENYFLGSFSPDGFKGNFLETICKKDYKTVILKGGAGTGKSTLMKRIAAHFEEGFGVEKYYCSSDPDSLDAVVVKELKRIIVDGTAPHVFDPIYPGVRQEILNLGEFWDEKKLAPCADEIIRITGEHKKLMERTKRYVQAISSVYADTYTLADDALLRDKLEGFTERLIKKVAPKKNGFTGKIEFKSLSALTPLGYKTQTETLDGYEIYLIRDSFFAGSDRLLRELADAFSSRGKDVSVSLCNIFGTPVYEHLLVPEMKLGFVTADPLTEINLDGVKPVNMLRFYDKKAVSQRKHRLRLNQKACDDLVSEAAKTMKAALATHDRLEKYYISAMDFTEVRKLVKKLADEFEREP